MKTEKCLDCGCKLEVEDDESIAYDEDGNDAIWNRELEKWSCQRCHF